MKKYKIKALLFLIVISLLISSCDIGAYFSNPTPEPRSEWVDKWLSNPTCQPPCWENIIPGKSTFDDAVKVLNSIPGLKLSLYPFRIQWIFDPLSSGSGAIDSDQTGRTVSIIYLKFDTYQKPVTVKEINSAFGEPTDVDFYDCRIHALQKSCVVNLIYTNSGMVVDLFLEDYGEKDYQVKILQDSIVGSVMFIPAEEDSYAKIFGKNNSDYPNYRFKWKGFTNYP